MTADDGSGGNARRTASSTNTLVDPTWGNGTPFVNVARGLVCSQFISRVTDAAVGCFIRTQGILRQRSSQFGSHVDALRRHLGAGEPGR